jgi:hypothetical protein
MTQHLLQGRSEREILWYQRRSFLSAAATWTALGGYSLAQAQERSNIVEIRGDCLLNGSRMTAQSVIQTGDRIDTGPGAGLVFVLGNSSFLVRQNSRMAVERGFTLNVISVLRLVTGAVVSVWGKGTSRQIVTPTLTAGIRGTGVYTEVFPERNNRTYFCNCYGEVDVAAGNERSRSRADYHQSFWAEPEPVNGQLLRPAGAINHGDEELEALAALVNQRTNWQIMGKKGVKDGKGYMDEAPGNSHPAAPPAPAPAR